jgi:peptidoglycan/LPS O-acetylase OafA/YrhL
LTRIKTINNSHLSGLDHLRAAAIILVFLFHYRMFQHPDWVDSVGSFGWSGVDLFFVLSGYLIAGQLFHKIAKEQSISLKEFFLKRVFRILPAYLTVLTIYFLFPAFHEREALPPLWKFLTFTQNFGLDLRQYGTFSHAWSLCIEEQFYLLLPFILCLLLYMKALRKGIFILLILFAGTIAFRLYNWKFVLPTPDAEDFGFRWYQHIYYPSYTRLDGLLMGIAIAALHQFLPGLRNGLRRYGNVLIVAGLLMLGLAWIVCADEMSYRASTYGFTLISIAYGVILTAAISPASILYRFSSKITSFIAALSYAIYLSHKGIIHLAQPFFGKLGIEPDSSLMFLFCAISCLLGALLLRYTIEKPFLKLRDEILKKKKTQKKALIADN